MTHRDLERILGRTRHLVGNADGTPG